MALQKNFTHHGINVSNGYVKISSVSGNKANVFIQVDYCFENGSEPIKTSSFSFAPDMDGYNFIKQGYLHLKSLDEFADAGDV